jgi:hypothetical protein
MGIVLQLKHIDCLMDPKARTNNPLTTRNKFHNQRHTKNKNERLGKDTVGMQKAS